MIGLVLFFSSSDEKKALENSNNQIVENNTVDEAEKYRSKNEYKVSKRPIDSPEVVNLISIENGKLTYIKKLEDVNVFLNYIKNNTEYKYTVDKDVYGYANIRIVDGDIALSFNSFLVQNGLTMVSSNKNDYIIPNDKKTEYSYRIEFENAE